MRYFKTLRGKILLTFLITHVILLSVSIIYGIITSAAMDEGREAVECYFKHTFLMYCPGCGGSRSLVYLLRFDIIRSFMYFPALPISALLILDVDIRAVISFVKNSFEPLKNFKVNSILIIPAVIIFTFILRNVLLLAFGIDLLGDISQMIT